MERKINDCASQLLAFDSCTSGARQKCQNGYYLYKCPYLNKKLDARSDLRAYYSALAKAADLDFKKYKALFRRAPVPFASRFAGQCGEGKGTLRASKEDFIFKCFYRSVMGYCDSCEKNQASRCPYVVDFDPANAYEICDYQWPVLSSDGQAIDLVFKSKKNPRNIYLVEGKSPVNEKETFLRMICEMLTYYFSFIAAEKALPQMGYRLSLAQSGGKATTIEQFNKTNKTAFNFVPSIVFFQGSPQHKEYIRLFKGEGLSRLEKFEKACLLQLLRKYSMAVFMFSSDFSKPIRLVKVKQFRPADAKNA